MAEPPKRKDNEQKDSSDDDDDLVLTVRSSDFAVKRRPGFRATPGPTPREVAARTRGKLDNPDGIARDLFTRAPYFAQVLYNKKPISVSPTTTTITEAGEQLMGNLMKLPQLLHLYPLDTDLPELRWHVANSLKPLLRSEGYRDHL